MVAGKIKGDKDHATHIDTLCHRTALMTFFGARNTENGAPYVGLGVPAPGLSASPDHLLIPGTLVGELGHGQRTFLLDELAGLHPCLISLSCTFLPKYAEFRGSLLDMTAGRPTCRWKWQLNPSS